MTKGVGKALMNIPVEFLLFGVTLLGVALTHTHALRVALIGLAAIAAWKVGVSGFPAGAGVAGGAGCGGGGEEKRRPQNDGCGLACGAADGGALACT